MKALPRRPLRSPGLFARLRRALWLENTMPCVGLVVLGGCLTFLIAPDERPSVESRLAAAGVVFPTVVIDPGHGGKDDGARANGLVEKELTLDVAQRVNRLLQQFGFPTTLTRVDDTFVSLPERAALANRIENSLLVSIHFNQSLTSVSTGVETFFASEKIAPESTWSWVGIFNKPEPEGKDRGETLAGFIQAALIMRTDATNRGIKDGALYVVRHTRGPAALVECGFLSNPFEARLIANSEYRDILAKAIVEGVMSYTRTRPGIAEPPALAQR